ncbi:MAG: aminopeptidase P family protein [Actinobacteria bacterium]|nr:aminopeptidase P family protein [Actinomycetota bacterium]
MSATLKPSTGVDREALAAEIVNRRQLLAKRMESAGLDAVVVASEANDFYLTGYETTFFGNLSKPLAVVFAPPARPVVICHVGEATSVGLDAIDVDVEPYTGPDALDVDGHLQIEYQLPAARAVAAHLRRVGARVVGMELSWHFIPGFTPLAFDALGQELGEVRDASGILWELRRVKSEWEIGQMALAAEVAEAAHRAFAAAAEIGMSERDLNRLIRLASYEAGAEKIGYSGIIAGIDRAPLGGPTNRTWERGQSLFVDICLQLNGGYFADFNRMYTSVEPTEAEAEAYQEIVDGLDRGRASVRAGAKVSEVARALLGDGETIYSRVGHGLGLEMPEPPSLSPDDETTLRSGEVICLEPNLEIPGVGWFVSEEEVVVRDGGFDLLSPPFPRGLRVIG